MHTRKHSLTHTAPHCLLTTARQTWHTAGQRLRATPWLPPQRCSVVWVLVGQRGRGHTSMSLGTRAPRPTPATRCLHTSHTRTWHTHRSAISTATRPHTHTTTTTSRPTRTRAHTACCLSTRPHTRTRTLTPRRATMGRMRMLSNTRNMRMPNSMRTIPNTRPLRRRIMQRGRQGRRRPRWSARPLPTSARASPIATACSGVGVPRAGVEGETPHPRSLAQVARRLLAHACLPRMPLFMPPLLELLLERTLA